MLLGRNAIKQALESERIKAYRNGELLAPGDLAIGTNSVDVTLSNKFIRIRAALGVLDPYDPGSLATREWECQDLVLAPGDTVLGATQERFEITGPFGFCGVPCDIAPMYEGRSTCGRLFLASHITAGYGDVGFRSAWTLELKNMGDCYLKLYAGMRIGQVAFQFVVGGVGEEYHGAYTEQHGGPKAPVLGRERF